MKRDSYEALALEVIRFLRKWGMWRDTIILTDGDEYAYSSDTADRFQEIPNVRFTEDVDPEEYLKGILCPEDCGEDLDHDSLMNPEHIFDMIYEGPLYMLFVQDEAEVRKADLSEEAWDYILENTGLVKDYLRNEHDLEDIRDLLNRIKGDKFDNPERSAWDPLVFDTWEEYQCFCGGEEEGLPVNSDRYDTYEDYLRDMEACEEMSIKDVMPIWEKLISEARQQIKAYDREDELINITEIAGHIYEEFEAIFRKYGLWFDFGFCWSLTCYRIEESIF